MKATLTVARGPFGSVTTPLMKKGNPMKMGTAPKVNILKVALRPILSEKAAHPNRPTKLPKKKITFLNYYYYFKREK